MEFLPMYLVSSIPPSSELYLYSNSPYTPVEVLGVEDELDELAGVDDELEELVDDELAELLEASEEVLSADDELLDCSEEDEELVELLDVSEEVEVLSELLVELLDETLDELSDCSEDIAELVELLGVSEEDEVFSSSPHAVKVKSIAAAVTALKIFWLIFIVFSFP